MKHSGKARSAGLKIVFWTFVLLVLIFVVGVVAVFVASFVSLVFLPLIALWALFVLFTFYFFRDPEARVPAGANLIVSPGHGKVDFIGETAEPEFMGGPCQRISMFLSVMDVHVQNAPVSGKVVFFKYRAGKFLNAMKPESAVENENAMFGFVTSEPTGEKVGVRLIAGVLARRIVPWTAVGDEVARGERISLIQFGSRVDIYLPFSARIKIKLGDRLVGGETVIAVFE